MLDTIEIKFLFCFSNESIAIVQTTQYLIQLEQFETALKHLSELSLANVDYIPQTLDCMDKLGKYEDIHALWDAFQKEIEEHQIKAKQKTQELMELAIQVKKQLYLLVEQKNYSAAKEVLTSYDKIIPNDPDLDEVRALIQTSYLLPPVVLS